MNFFRIVLILMSKNILGVKEMQILNEFSNSVVPCFGYSINITNDMNTALCRSYIKSVIKNKFLDFNSTVFKFAVEKTNTEIVLDGTNQEFDRKVKYALGIRD